MRGFVSSSCLKKTVVSKIGIFTQKVSRFFLFLSYRPNEGAALSGAWGCCFRARRINNALFARHRDFQALSSSLRSLNKDIHKDAGFWEIINGVFCSRGAIEIVPIRIVYLGGQVSARSFPIRSRRVLCNSISVPWR